MTDTTKDFELTIKVRNHRILARMRQEGVTNIKDLAQRAGISSSMLGEIIRLKLSGQKKRGDWRAAIIKLATYFECTPSDLIPPSVWDTVPEKTQASIAVNLEDIPEITTSLRALALPASSHLDHEQTVAAINDMFKRLTPKEERIVRKSFAIGCEYQSCDDIGEDMGVSGGRVQQIKEQAMRKLARKYAKQKLLEAFGVDHIGEVFAEFEDP